MIFEKGNIMVRPLQTNDNHLLVRWLSNVTVLEFYEGRDNPFYLKRVIMDPQRTNSRAIRCYEKCGFKKVRILPKHEFHEGELRDCWLIEFNRSI